MEERSWEVTGDINRLIDWNSEFLNVVDKYKIIGNSQEFKVNSDVKKGNIMRKKNVIILW